MKIKLVSQFEQTKKAKADSERREESLSVDHRSQEFFPAGASAGRALLRIEITNKKTTPFPR
jgi:hypothetical protein